MPRVRQAPRALPPQIECTTIKATINVQRRGREPSNSIIDIGVTQKRHAKSFYRLLKKCLRFLYGQAVNRASKNASGENACVFLLNIRVFCQPLFAFLRIFGIIKISATARAAQTVTAKTMPHGTFLSPVISNEPSAAFCNFGNISAKSAATAQSAISPEIDTEIAPVRSISSLFTLVGISRLKSTICPR